MVEENAIVVMEDLNQGFMRGRQKVERQVYQKLEKMLIDKLNYLVFKAKNVTEPGGLLKALQLTSKFDSFKSMGKQSGFLFYVPAWNTSKIDPATGFVDFLKPKYENIEKAKAFFKKFEVIRFNADKNYFEFQFDYNDFTSKAEGTQTNWIVCTQGKERYAWNTKLNNGKGAVEKIDVTENLQLLFGKAGISYASGSDLITDITNQESADFFKKLMRLLAVTLSLRHTNGKNGNEEKDFILSPVSKQGVFFNSMEADENAGTLTTRPVTFNGKYLFVNTDCLQGELKVEILDKHNKVNAAFSMDKCNPVSANSTIQQMSWNGVEDLSSLAGKKVKFRFHLKMGKLYSFWVSPEISGASHGYNAAGGPGFSGSVDIEGKEAYNAAGAFSKI